MFSDIKLHPFQHLSLKINGKTTNGATDTAQEIEKSRPPALEQAELPCFEFLYWVIDCIVFVNFIRFIVDYVIGFFEKTKRRS